MPACGDQLPSISDKPEALDSGSDTPRKRKHDMKYNLTPLVIQTLRG